MFKPEQYTINIRLKTADDAVLQGQKKASLIIAIPIYTFISIFISIDMYMYFGNSH